MFRKGVLFLFMLVCCTAMAESQSTAQQDMRLICQFSNAWPKDFGNRDIVCRSDVLATFTDSEANDRVTSFWNLYTDAEHSREYFIQRATDLEATEKEMKAVAAANRAKAEAQMAEQRRTEEEEIAAAEEAERERVKVSTAKRKAASLAAVEKEKAARYRRDHPDEATLHSMDVWKLCALFRRTGTTESEAELYRRKAFTPLEMSLIVKGSVNIGMSEAAMLCSLGPADDRNRTVTISGERIQWIYGRRYIYTDNGKITAWQD